MSDRHKGVGRLRLLGGFLACMGVPALCGAGGCATRGGLPERGLERSSETPPGGSPPARAQALVLPDAQRGPGQPVSAPDEERRLARWLDLVLARQGQKALPAFAEKVILGPALWGIVEASGGKMGKPMTFVLPTEGGAVRLQGRLLAAADLLPLLDHAAFRRTLKKARWPGPHPGSLKERARFYRMVPYEIAGKPVSVSGEEKHRLLIVVTGGKIVHLDAIGRYHDP